MTVKKKQKKCRGAWKGGHPDDGNGVNRGTEEKNRTATVQCGALRKSSQVRSGQKNWTEN